MEIHPVRGDIKCQPAAQADSWEINLPRTGPGVLLPPRPLACVLLCCVWVRGGGQPKVKLGELCIFGEGVWLLLLWLLQRTRLRVFSDAEPDRQLLGKSRQAQVLHVKNKLREQKCVVFFWFRCAQTHVLKLFGGDALLPLWCILRGGWAWMCVFRPLVLRTCLRIQARRFVRQLCSESTSRDQGLHSAISRAEIATARPTWCTTSTGLLQEYHAIPMESRVKFLSGASQQNSFAAFS